MSVNDSPAITFEQIKNGKGTNPPGEATGDDYPLQAWYRSIRQKPIREFAVEDLCKACRQVMHIEHVVPVAVETLARYPQAGELYDGELVLALKSIPAAFWPEHRAVANTLQQIIEQHLPDFDEDVQDDARELLTRLR
ncbi:MAG: hypothetical protein EXS36_15365 [Pedosphaera sp.]|nr:hypothetical protein [Pedosphaera sp.]